MRRRPPLRSPATMWRRSGRRTPCRCPPSPPRIPTRASARPITEPDHPMPRTQKVVRPEEAKGDIIDTVLLKYEDRIKQQGFVFGGKGTCVEFDFPVPPLLRTDDLLLLDDGRLIEVVAEVEPVLEVR